MLLSDGEQLLDRETTLSHKIAFSDIVSIEVENFNLTNTIFLSLGILGVGVILAFVILAIGMSGMGPGAL